MFRDMRRGKQLLPHDTSVDILTKGTSGVLALLGDGGYPYAVPLSYVYHQGKLYFHGAKVGHKIDAARACPKASFCVVEQDQVVAEEYTTYFRSVIVFGQLRILEDQTELMDAIQALGKKYFPGDTPEHRQQAIDREFTGMGMLELTIEHMTGKEAVELMRRRTQN